MSNLLLDANNWHDNASNSPPACWDGSAYIAVNQEEDLTLAASVAAGDVVACTLDSTDGIGTVVVRSADATILATWGPVDAPTEFSIDAQAGMSLQIDGGLGCASDTLTLTPTANPVVATSYNCECDDDYPTQTLAQLRQRMVVRLGYAALTVAPPGLVLLMNDFLFQAQVLLYRKYSCFRMVRWFTWNMAQGQRFFDFNDNDDTCSKVMDPRKVQWVGISKGDNCWQELVCGINPVFYRSMTQAIPQFYDIRQCIEIWPAPSTNEWQLRIKGDFGLLPLAADSDVTTIDPEAVFLLALANAKAHYEQPDAGTTMQMAMGLIADLTAGSHFTRRYIPGSTTLPNAVPPKMVP